MSDARRVLDIDTLRRRAFLGRTAMGLGSVALAALLSDESRAEELQSATPAITVDPLATRAPHFAPRADRVIFLHMVGAPSQLDLFDDKPKLRQLDGEPVPKSVLEGRRFAFLRGHPRLLGSPFRFARHGVSGALVSELLPEFASVVDDVAFIRSLHTNEFNHGPAQLFFQTGFGNPGRPSLGSWTTYGLGRLSEDLPAFVVLLTGLTPGAGNSLWGSGFLPSVYQGTRFRSKGDAVLFASSPEGVDRRDRRRVLDTVRDLNRIHLDEIGDPEIATRLSTYEMAFRMQASLPELMDTSSEPARVHELYGTQPGQASFANNCLLARRLVERGVRFVQLYDQGWDHHSNLRQGMVRKARAVDQGMAALITDLKQRGLLERTLVVWGAEFGRTPMLQPSGDRSRAGRDHQRDAYTVWMAGGGIRAGAALGETDELGHQVAEDPVHVHDLHATILHLLGLDHETLTYRYQGREFRLTDVEGDIVTRILS